MLEDFRLCFLHRDAWRAWRKNAFPFSRVLLYHHGRIAVGADAEQTYLRAASHAEYFIALVSKNYFQSDFCKREIAHAARCRRRLIRVNIPPVPPAPNDMPWIDGPNWHKQQGKAIGLEPALE